MSPLEIGGGCSLFYLSRWICSTEAGHDVNEHGLVPTLPDGVLVSSFTLRGTTGSELPRCRPSVLTSGSAQDAGREGGCHCYIEGNDIGRPPESVGSG